MKAEGKTSVQGEMIAMDGDLIVMNEKSSDSADPSSVSFKRPTVPNRET
jgi:hypothetical protein